MNLFYNSTTDAGISFVASSNVTVNGLHARSLQDITSSPAKIRSMRPEIDGSSIPINRGSPDGLSFQVRERGRLLQRTVHADKRHGSAGSGLVCGIASRRKCEIQTRL